MKHYTTQQEAIIDLHQRGFTSDFHLFGNDLLWIQEKIFVRAGEFSILESHRIDGTTKNGAGIVLFGILIFSYGVKGILINHYTSYTTQTPPVILKKLKESRLYTPEYNYA
jgi:hypothetical protein